MLTKTLPVRNGYFATFGKYATFIETSRKVINDNFIKDFLTKTSIPFNRSLGDDVIISRLKNTPHFKRWSISTLTPKEYAWSEQQQIDFHKPPTELLYDITYQNGFGCFRPSEIDYIIM